MMQVFYFSDIVGKSLPYTVYFLKNKYRVIRYKQDLTYISSFTSMQFTLGGVGVATMQDSLKCMLKFMSSYPTIYEAAIITLS